MENLHSLDFATLGLGERLMGGAGKIDKTVEAEWWQHYRITTHLGIIHVEKSWFSLNRAQWVPCETKGIILQKYLGYYICRFSLDGT